MTSGLPEDAGVHHLRVRYAETDQMGVAHHSSYVPWIEEARTEWMRARGRSYREMEDQGLALTVVRLDIRYRESARYDEVIRIRTWMDVQHRASVTLAYRLFRVDSPEAASEQVLAEAETRLALLGRDGSLLRIPDDLFGSGV
ncbi:MAG: esterase [Planctomycetes bacterium]|jgi:acyl-CoA thioester hydrolase|nr:esterase [Planctomycetota bacterium]MDP6425303.1 thioesterase family protein [Planctomycetota bacterium]